MDRVLDRRCGAGEALSLLRRRAGRGPRPRRLLLAGTALAGALMLAPSLAQAQNATWTGSTDGNWNLNANWLPASVPTGTATFDATGLTQAVTVTADASINTMLFSAGAPAYSYTINAGVTGVTFDIIGAGIINNSANAPNFLNNGILNFSNSSTAANAIIVNNNTLNFNNSSTAANANITNNNTITFNNKSTAGSAGVINDGFLFFSNTSTAATATVLNNGAITFQDSSSAGSAAITNNGGGSLISFADTSTAGSATITTNGGARTQFTDKGNGGSAQFITNAGGIVDFSGTTGAAGNNQVTAGSIAGAGTYRLGSNQLTVGSNNLSTVVSGTIEDGPTPTGGSLVKVGSGVLTLSGTNTYTGATTINAGTLIAASSGALPTTAVTVNTGATLIIADTVQADIGSLAGGGSVQIGTADPGTNLFIGLANPATTTFSGAITGPGSLELDGGQLTLTGAGNNIGGNLDLCACDVGGITIKGGAFVVGGSTSVEGGTLAVTNGGTLATGDLLVGTKMVIDGAGSTVTATGNTGVGLLGSGPLGAGTLTISGGGVLNSQGPTEIDNFDGTPTATVTGAGSKWNVSGPMTVGNGTFRGPGILTISNGGTHDCRRRRGQFARLYRHRCWQHAQSWHRRPRRCHHHPRNR
jgi:autotransporter-associated beta strand protein/T5SS/PEP-CTERM-associated repeat protein